MIKVVAITQRLVRDGKTLEIREALDINWARLFQSIDLLPVSLPIGCDFKKYFKNMKISGIVLTGGNDLSSLTKDNLSVMRDKREKELIEFAIKQNLPLFGICRGMQIIAEYFGANIIKVRGHVGSNHKILLNKRSKHKNILTRIKKVNSFHNYAVGDIGRDLLISAWSEDGVIEAIEHFQYKIFGQMWHPERERPFSQADLEFIKKYF